MVGRQNCEEKNDAALDPKAYGSVRVGPSFHGRYQHGLRTEHKYGRSADHRCAPPRHGQRQWLLHGPDVPEHFQIYGIDPKTNAGQQSGWVQEECSPKLYPAAKGEYMKDVLAEMERLNVTAVVFGDPKSVQKWKNAAPNRVILGTDFEKGDDRVPLDELRKDFTSGGMKVMGEVSLQYGGTSPSDPSVDKYFALAEELDIPVAIHMGTGGSGRVNLLMPRFRGSAGNPLLLEELLARHPRLRVQIMHAGYPMIDNLLTLLQANSHVYVDVAGLIWSYR